MKRRHWQIHEDVSPFVFAPSSSLWLWPAHFAYVGMSIVKMMPCESSQFKIHMLIGMEKVRGNTESWFSSEFLFKRTWLPPLYLLSLDMDAFSSSMPCSPEYSAEWVGYILMMCFWGGSHGARKQGAVLWTKTFWAGYRKCSLFQVKSEALISNTEKLYSLFSKWVAGRSLWHNPEL